MQLADLGDTLSPFLRRTPSLGADLSLSGMLAAAFGDGAYPLTVHPWTVGWDMLVGSHLGVLLQLPPHAEVCHPFSDDHLGLLPLSQQLQKSTGFDGGH